MAQNNDAVMAEVISAMDEIRIPDRPWDRLESSGPPAAPIEFPAPRCQRGLREDVLVYDVHTRKHQLAHGVLFRDFSREYGETPERALSRVQQAYWPIPYKERIKTIMGHVEICYVLQRCAVNNSDDSLSDDDSEAENDEEDDVLFEVTTQHVAVKVNYGRRIERYRGRHAENPLQEVAAMQLIGNSNIHIMGTIETLFEGSNLNVIMPYAGSGDLFQRLQESQERGQGFPEAEARFWFRQIIDGILYLHGKGVCHRDLSPENIMIDNDNSLIIDMGMAIQIPYTNPNTTNDVTDIVNGSEKRLIAPQGACGKLPYMSPEIYQNQRPFDGGAVDIWTAGTILFCMVTGNRSYARPHNSDAQFYWMTHGLSRLLSDWGVNLSNECSHLLRNILQVDARLRFTLDEVLDHPWFSHDDVVPARIQAENLFSTGRISI